MKILLFLIPLITFSVGIAYAEPLENIRTTVLDYSNSTATVQVTWEIDEDALSYKIGCVSCFPNLVESVSVNKAILGNVTSLPNSSIAILYGLAYDIENNLISAVQIFVDLSPKS